jgi:hypothetical protein
MGTDSRKPYMAEDYMEHMERPIQTDHIGEQPESEFKKPYAEGDSYPEMEYFYSPPQLEGAGPYDWDFSADGGPGEEIQCRCSGSLNVDVFPVGVTGVEEMQPGDQMDVRAYYGKPPFAFSVSSDYANGGSAGEFEEVTVDDEFNFPPGDGPFLIPCSDIQRLTPIWWCKSGEARITITVNSSDFIPGGLVQCQGVKTITKIFDSSDCEIEGPEEIEAGGTYQYNVPGIGIDEWSLEGLGGGTKTLIASDGELQVDPCECESMTIVAKSGCCGEIRFTPTLRDELGEISGDATVTPSSQHSYTYGGGHGSNCYEWTVSGNTDGNTVISASGVLDVGAAECGMIAVNVVIDCGGTSETITKNIRVTGAGSQWCCYEYCSPADSGAGGPQCVGGSFGAGTCDETCEDNRYRSWWGKNCRSGICDCGCGAPKCKGSAPCLGTCEALAVNCFFIARREYEWMCVADCSGEPAGC